MSAYRGAGDFERERRVLELTPREVDVDGAAAVSEVKDDECGRVLVFCGIGFSPALPLALVDDKDGGIVNRRSQIVAQP